MRTSPNPHSSLRQQRPYARGFTLVELMVGLVLGLLTVLVISQVLSMSEGQRRTLTMGSDAQINGAMSLYTLQRDMQMAGYGVATNPAALGCAIRGGYKDPGADASSAPIPFNPTLTPVLIQDGANGAPDTITVLQSHTSGFSAPVLLMDKHDQTDEFFTVKSSFGVNAGDLMIVVPKDGAATGVVCAMFNVTNDGTGSSSGTALDATHVPHVVGGSSRWNRTSVFPTAAYDAGSYLLNMGKMSFNTYSVNTTTFNLESTSVSSESASSTPQPLYPQIVNLQAMYGKDTAGTGQVSAYDNVAPTTSADWQRVLSIRLALVARSSQYEKEEVTAGPPQWDVGAASTMTGAFTCGTSKCVSLKVDHVPDWQHYRYKVYDTIVPLRNVLWNSATNSAAP